MKKKIHPDFKETQYVCSCGNSFKIHSTMGGTVKLEICSACHPFYAGNQKMVDTEGRIEKFNRRYKKN
jgi:large subunit ribosomal protein L31